jgi:hypothetical protein
MKRNFNTHTHRNVDHRSHISRLERNRKHRLTEAHIIDDRWSIGSTEYRQVVVLQDGGSNAADCCKNANRHRKVNHQG